jgi:hypothetical protein
LSQTSDAARQAFEGHFEKVATDPDTNMDAMADIIVRSTASGILIAARETIRLVHDAADVYLKSMSAIPIVSDNSRGYFRERSREVVNAFSCSGPIMLVFLIFSWRQVSIKVVTIFRLCGPMLD